MARLLAERGESVHVIGQRWRGAERETEEHVDGRLVIHRLAYRDWKAAEPAPLLDSPEIQGLFRSGYHPQCFGWQASLLAEQLVEQYGIDLVEAQEFEAPLYYFQLRRALGLGPSHTPPCLVHLHSPTELIVRHNDWNIHERFWRIAKRLESYTIAAADRLLCPSRYLARQVERHHGMPEESVVTIPLPAAAIPPIDRSEETWRRGSLLYVGRLERRKGILEWLQAAVSLARRDPTLQFEFVGGNVLGTGRMSGSQTLRRLVPADLARRFVFHGSQPYSELPRFLARARIAVVPSRWENFPNTCVEAMCSGLPVLASPEGGMREIVDDGRTGWLAASASPRDLAAALERALSTPAASLAAMGRQASEDIHRICSRDEIVERQLALRREIVGQGARASLSLPNLSWPGASPSGGPTRRPAPEDGDDAIAVVVTCFDAGARLTECVESLVQQRAKPAAVVIVDLGSREPDTTQRLAQLAGDGWKIMAGTKDDSARARNAAVEAILGAGLQPLAFVFLEAEGDLDPEALARFEMVLRNRPEVGLVSSWVAHTRTRDRASMPPNPSFPYQWVLNEAAPFAAVRTTALREAGLFRPLPSEAYQAWDLVNAVMAAGWAAVTLPEILGRASPQETAGLAPALDHRYRELRRALLSRFPDAVARDGAEMILLTESLTLDACQEQFVRLRQSLSFRRQLVEGPRGLALRVARRVKRELRRWSRL